MWHGLESELLLLELLPNDKGLPEHALSITFSSPVSVVVLTIVCAGLRCVLP